MGTPVRIIHENDPADEIRDDVGKLCEGITPLGSDCLIIMYERVGPREAKSAGGIWLPEVKNGTASEDKYQGKVGLLMKKGPIAFKEDASHDWGGVAPEVGDWVMVNVAETYSFDLPIYAPGRGSSATGQRRARIVQDVYIKGIVAPEAFDAIW